MNIARFVSSYGSLEGVTGVQYAYVSATERVALCIGTDGHGRSIQPQTRFPLYCLAKPVLGLRIAAFAPSVLDVSLSELGVSGSEDSLRNALDHSACVEPVTASEFARSNRHVRSTRKFRTLAHAKRRGYLVYSDVTPYVLVERALRLSQPPASRTYEYLLGDGLEGGGFLLDRHLHDVIAGERIGDHRSGVTMDHRHAAWYLDLCFPALTSFGSIEQVCQFTFRSLSAYVEPASETRLEIRSRSRARFSMFGQHDLHLAPYALPVSDQVFGFVAWARSGVVLVDPTSRSVEGLRMTGLTNRITPDSGAISAALEFCRRAAHGGPDSTE